MNDSLNNSLNNLLGFGQSNYQPHDKVAAELAEYVRQVEQDKGKTVPDLKLPVTASETLKDTSRFRINPFPNYYIMHNVPFKDEFLGLCLEKQPPERRPLHLHEYVESALNSVYRVASAPLVYSILRVMYLQTHNKNISEQQYSLIEELKNEFSETMKRQWLLTDSVLTYNDDEVQLLHKTGFINHYGKSWKKHFFFLKKPVKIGSGIQASLAASRTEDIFWTAGVEEVFHVFWWLTGKEPYLQLDNIGSLDAPCIALKNSDNLDRCIVSTCVTTGNVCGVQIFSKNALPTLGDKGDNNS